MIHPAVGCVGDGDLFWAGEAGKTDTSGPLSTRKERRWRRQKTESAPSRDDTEEMEEMAGGVLTVEVVPGVTGNPGREH